MRVCDVQQFDVEVDIGVSITEPRASDRDRAETTVDLELAGQTHELMIEEHSVSEQPSPVASLSRRRTDAPTACSTGRMNDPASSDTGRDTHVPRRLTGSRVLGPGLVVLGTVLVPLSGLLPWTWIKLYLAEEGSDQFWEEFHLVSGYDLLIEAAGEGLSSTLLLSAFWLAASGLSLFVAVLALRGHRPRRLYISSALVSAVALALAAWLVVDALVSPGMYGDFYAWGQLVVAVAFLLILVGVLSGGSSQTSPYIRHVTGSSR